MSSISSKIPKDFIALSSDDRIEFVQGLWDFIAETPDQVSIPDSHKRILDQRLAAYKADPNLGKPWSQVRDKLLKTLQDT